MHKSITVAAIAIATALCACKAEVKLKTPEPAPAAEPAPEVVEAEPTPEYITIRDRIQFHTNRAELIPESKEVLDEVAATLLGNEHIELVEIEGHTDSTGHEEANMQLSEARALEVRNYLIQRGVRGDRLLARGFGEDMPIADNSTSNGRRDNRRVEFRIVRQGAGASSSGAIAADN